MTLTEAEARERWPMARGPRNFGNAIHIANRNQEGDPISESKCIASRCMMWRWFDSPVMGAFREAETGIPRPERRGFCGLAGRP